MRDLIDPIDFMWVLSCGFLVLLMQAGFSCLESGMVRAKNSINVAIKNLVDFCISGVLFYVLGFGLMFGASAGGLLGTDHFSIGADSSPGVLAFFFFQLVFCGTATTIVSGAVAERMRFAGYCVTAAVLAGVVYPIVGHWGWGGTLEGDPTGWLAKLGFVDFAGATVVHSVGGWIALTALLIIGPRVGRFDGGGRSIEGHSLPTATLGAFLLWFGWFGFNGGSTFGVTDQIPRIIVNTALAGVAGGLAGLAAAWYWLGKPVVDRIINGVIAGLVAITASCHVMHPAAALVIGGVGGAICIGAMAWMSRVKIDDAIGAVPVHLFGGIWGTIALALFAPADALGTGLTRWEQLGVQALGVVTIGAYALTVSYVLLRTLNRWIPLRVSREDERIGLNIAEHGSSTAILDLITQMDQQAQLGDFSEHVRVEPETEAASVAVFYNSVLDRFGEASRRTTRALERLDKLANYDELTGLATRRLYFEALERAVARAKRQGHRGAVLYLDLDGFKKVNDRFGHDAGDHLLKLFAERVGAITRRSDTLARLGGDEFSLIMEGLEQDNSAEIVAHKILEAVQRPFVLAEDKEARVGVSIGIAYFPDPARDHAHELVRLADEAMFEAKLDGKGKVVVHGTERAVSK